MDDSILVALLGEALLAETAARREAGRAILDAARYTKRTELCARLAERDHGPAVTVEIVNLLRRFGMAEGESCPGAGEEASPRH